MKILPVNLTKKIINKKLQKRTEERLQHVIISKYINKSDKNFLNTYKDSLARYAEKHNLALRFINKEDNVNTPIMQVFETITDPDYTKADKFVYKIARHKESVILPADMPANPQKSYNKIKNILQQILKKDTGLNKNIRGFFLKLNRQNININK